MKPGPSAVRTRHLVRARTAARSSGRGALVVLVGMLVVGILGMHAVASHSAPSSPTATPSTAMSGTTSGHHTATTVHGTYDALAHSATAADSPTARADASSSTGPGSGHGLGGMVMMCVVMLAAAALTLLLLLAVRIVGPLLPAAFHPAAARARTRQWVRGTGPPHVWAFSVIRC